MTAWMILYSTLLGASPQQPAALPRWEPQSSGVTASLRAVSAVDRDVAWASGASGAVLLTTDGGQTWSPRPIPGGESLDYRDVHAFSARDAFVLSAGLPARLYKTTDGGATWALNYENTREGVFFDAMDFWDETAGIAFSDPVAGHLLVIRTSDGGESWTELPASSFPPALEGEAGFAGSGTCLRVFGAAGVWIGLGGPAARVFASADRGETWRVAETPIRHGLPSAGIFSFAIRAGGYGVAVGGDYLAEADPTANAAFTRDGGATWELLASSPPAGFRECVAWVPGASPPMLVTVGPSGSDFSLDDGVTWSPFGRSGFHSVSFASDGAGWAVGGGGTIARFTIDN